MEFDVDKFISEYDFLNFIHEDKSQYKHASELGYNDPNDLFLVGDSGGFLMNIQPGDRFVNTNLLTEVADFYRKEGIYTPFKEDSIPHRQFRKREEYRRRYGFDAPCLERNGKIINLHISGDYYNFINYTRMERLKLSTAKSTERSNVGEKYYDVPRFIDAQFWSHAIIEFARLNGFHIIIDKTRRGGFSYMMAAKSANRLNLNPRKVVIHVAADKKYLTKKGGLTDFAINNLLFYEQHTPFKRGILSTDKEEYILGYKLPNGIISPKAWNSSLFSVSAMNNPDCAIGKDAIEVNVEEISTMENFDEFMNVTEPAMRTGSYVTGLLCGWGTATSGNMQVFERNFYAPRSIKAMPFENVWDKDSRHEVCGYFKSYCWGLEGELNGVSALDEFGNSNFEIAIKIALKEREDKKRNSKTFAEYINYLGQYALRPTESFSSASENIFSSEALLDWETKLKMDTSYQFHTDGMLFEQDNKVIFKSNERIKQEGGIYNRDYFDYITGVPRKEYEHHHGCVRIWFHPIIRTYIDKDGESVKGVPPGIYSISYDPVGVNKENKELTDKHSHNAIQVWAEPCIYNGFKPALVACYYGRPEKLEQADKICLLLAKYYNCIGTTGVEINRGETVSNFTKWKATKYLMRDPVQLWDNSIKGSVQSSYGVNMGGGDGSGNGSKKAEGLRLLKEMLYSVIGKDDLGNDKYFFQTIYDYQTILELKKWNIQGNYDRVSAMIIQALRWKLCDIEAAKELQSRKKVVENKNDVWSRPWFKQ